MSAATDRSTGPWARLATEAPHPDSRDLDLLGSAEIVRLLVEEDRRGLERVLAVAEEIAAVAEQMAAVLAGGGRVLLAGAGTSGRLAVLEAAECPPTFGTDPESIVAAIAGGADAVFAAREGAEDREQDGRAAAAGAGAQDLLIGISASAVTPYVAGALAEAALRGAGTVLLTCAAPASVPPAAAATVLALDTGPEVLTGSTRLKAGSATKAALNAITTTAMVRLGKVHGHYMVDLRPGSAKLADRARRIVATVTGTDEATAAAWLEAAGGEVRLALAIAATGLDAAGARAALEATGGSLRALGSLPTHSR